MNNQGRPLSPHLTIYRWPITMVLSILHRMTGVALSVGFIVFVIWLEAIAYTSMSFDGFMTILSSWPGQLLLAGWCFAFFFHLCNGIRHLVWDTGRLFEKNQADMSAWVVLIASVLMTAVAWIVIGGGA